MFKVYFSGCFACFELFFKVSCAMFVIGGFRFNFTFSPYAQGTIFGKLDVEFLFSHQNFLIDVFLYPIRIKSTYLPRFFFPLGDGLLFAPPSYCRVFPPVS